MVQNQKGNTCSPDIHALTQITFPLSCRAHVVVIQLWKHFGYSESSFFVVCQ